MFYIRWLMEVILQLEPTVYSEIEYIVDRLHQTDFFWSVANDGNRIDDAHSLRMVYSDSEFVLQGELANFYEEVSVFEMMAALAARMVDLTGHDAGYHFIEMLSNLNLWPFTRDCIDCEEDVDIVVDSLLNRTYHETGHGGLFPLNQPMEDQTKVELWYQMQAYINEKYSIL